VLPDIAEGEILVADTRADEMRRSSELTCPHCGYKALESMPSDACVYFYECTGCGVLLKPKPGDCCVFCSYGSVPCPPVQAGEANCCD